MEERAEKGWSRLREFSQLLRIQERLLDLLREVLVEVRAPATLTLLKELRRRTGSTAPDNFSRIASSVEDAIRELKIFESELHRDLLDQRPGEFTVAGVPNLPPALARFLAEKTQNPLFSYQVHQDPVRGWVISWKEYTAEGMVRGFGQFYERPYAWLDE